MHATPVEQKERIAVVVMGVSGSGKSTIAVGIASALGLHFIDGDSLHTPASVAKMRAGTPLQDEDRWPWLDRIGASLADAARWPPGLVVACSALKRAYRDRIRGATPGVRFVFLDGSADLIGARMAERAGHYMPSTLLASQLGTLEVPGDDEPDVLRLGIEPPASEIVRRAVRALKGDTDPR
ncbi:MAG: gluconokinase [Caldimonas sp.]